MGSCVFNFTAMQMRQWVLILSSIIVGDSLIRWRCHL
jgi:hypothetical protein